MKKIECVYREILYHCLEKKTFTMSQAGLARSLFLSLSTVNLALVPLRRMNAVTIQPQGIHVIDAKKILYYWASIRNIDKDIIYQTRMEQPVRKIESQMPSSAIFGVFSAYKFTFHDVPADYSEIYVYGDEGEMKKRFPPNERPPNIIVLKKDEGIKYNKGQSTIGQTFVDLWNMKQWYAKDFLKALEARIDGILA